MATMKKSATPPRPTGDKVKISPSVKVILKQVGQLDAGSKQVLMQNIRAAAKPTAAEIKSVGKALKAANKPAPRTPSGSMKRVPNRGGGRMRIGGAGGLNINDLNR